MTTYEINLVPAYGRDYRTAKDVVRDWVEGKDFLIRDVGARQDDGRYTSIRDWAGKSVRIRYGRVEGLTPGWVNFTIVSTIDEVAGISDYTEDEDEQ